MCKFSIVCAFLNRENDIQRVVDSLLSQDFSEKFEIILIDNGSTDQTLNILKPYPDNFSNIKIIDGSYCKGSPYSARNIGIRESIGDYVAFIDGYANSNWLSEANNELICNNVDILAGKVNIEIDNNSSTYQLYDAIFSIDNEKIVRKFQRAPTANLFIKKEVFTELGLFNEKIRSGGDMIFTSNAVKGGAVIKYSENVVTSYFARDKKAILNKQKRISLGQPLIWESEKKISTYLVKSILKLCLFSSPLAVSKYIDSRSPIKISLYEKAKLYYLIHRLKFMMSYYNWIGLLKL